MPGGALWAAQTERCLRFFPIGQQRMPLDIVYAPVQVKHAAVEVNGDLGLLEPARRRSGSGALPLASWPRNSRCPTNKPVPVRNAT